MLSNDFFRTQGSRNIIDCLLATMICRLLLMKYCYRWVCLFLSSNFRTLICTDLMMRMRILWIFPWTHGWSRNWRTYMTMMMLLFFWSLRNTHIARRWLIWKSGNCCALMHALHPTRSKLLFQGNHFLRRLVRLLRRLLIRRKAHPHHVASLPNGRVCRNHYYASLGWSVT